MLYVCMSVAGSIPVLICALLWILQKQTYNYRLGKRLLVIGMFFYLIPFQVVKYLLPDWTVPILKLPMEINVEQDFYKVEEIKSVLSPGDSIWIPKWLLVFLIVWLCCIVVFAVYQVVKYRIVIKKSLSQSEKVSVVVEGEKVELLLNRHIYTPYTVGFIRQSIIVPEESLNHPCFIMVYRHENQHRKNHDSLMKLLCIIIICVHWMNPIAILLLLLYRVTAEYICDAKAVEGFSDEKKREYGNLVIDLSTVSEPLSMVWRNNLSGSEKLMKRRITYMMKKKGMMKRGIAIAATALTVFMSTSTILAYEPFKSVEEGDIEVSSFGEFGAFSIEDTSANYDDYDFSVSDNIFIREDGTQLAITDAISPNALCNHIMEDGYYNVHKSNSSGGCTVTVFKAKQCSKCGYLQIGDLYKTITYAVCTHK